MNLGPGTRLGGIKQVQQFVFAGPLSRILASQQVFSMSADTEKLIS